MYTPQGYQLCVGSGFDDVALTHNIDPVCIDNGAQSMGNGDHRASLFGFLKSLLNARFRL